MTTPPEFSKRARFSPEAMTFRTESTFTAHVEYPNLSLATLTAGHLTHARIFQSLLFRPQYRQESLGHPSVRDINRYHRGQCGPGPERGYPRQKAPAHRGRGHLLGCCPGACVCGPGRPGGETLDSPDIPPGGVRSAICRNFETSKAAFKIEDATATKFLMHPTFSGCTYWPRLDKGKGKKRAAGVPTAPVATAVDLGEEGGAPPAKRSNSSLLEETVYAMGALAGERSLDWGRGRNVVY